MQHIADLQEQNEYLRQQNQKLLAMAVEVIKIADENYPC